MKILALDVGSSSVKAQVFTNGVPLGELVHATYSTNHDGLKVEVTAEELLRAVGDAIAQLGPQSNIDLIGLSVMSPAWVAMDKDGNALTPIVTHQDRRAVEIAKQLEDRVGKDRHLQSAGNRPFPGGISSTTCAWFLANQPEAMARADLVGHLNTFLHRRMTGARVIDPSNASFTGLYLTCELSGWSEELCDAVGISQSVLPQVVDADKIAGRVTDAAAAQFGVKSGTPMITGMVDTSAAMLITGAADGQLFHNCGSTDVLARAADRPTPHEKLLTRGLGIGKKWISAATIAAAGSSLDWMRAQFFADYAQEKFFALVAELAGAAHETSVRFEPYLAGERTSIDQKQAAFSGLTLATRREDMLVAVMEALSTASGERMKLFSHVLGNCLDDVYVTGGGGVLAELMHRHWPGQLKYHQITEAALRGLATKGFEI